MTGQSKFGEVEKSKSGDWSKATVEANSDPITEDYGGDPRVIRQFWFSFNPETIAKIKKKELKVPSHQELFNAHAKQMEIGIWGDGLVFDTDFPPRIVVNKKGYKIIVVCKLRQGVMVGQDNKILKLTELLKKSP